MATRELVWDGCLNVRDLGGHRASDGRETRFSAVVRADSVRRLTDEGWEALLDYGIRTIVDLRFHEELEADPPRDLPVELVHVPVFPAPGDPLWRRIDRMEKGAGYLLLLEKGRSQFAEAVAAVGDAEEGGVVVHCMVGKDRTGLVAGLLLRLVGVPIDAIAQDYALSEQRLAPLIERWLADCDTEEERVHRLHVSGSPPEAMEAALRGIEASYGSVEEYLRSGGAPERALARVRDRLVA
jgi:protein tyrosine/serine phosphatase